MFQCLINDNKDGNKDGDDDSEKNVKRLPQDS